ncbi:MAG: DEAD/DEAH box helicase [Chlorobaculum sp.]|nr:DEAD/DEAH box helicase [Chlorobaculum sp.]
MPFREVLSRFRATAFSERDKGDRFERLMQAWLATDPQYAFRFSNIWLWNEFPARSDFGGKDTGIDLVALTHDGDYWAIQCKCWQQDAVIDKQEVDSFLSTSSREFRNDQFQTVSFAQRLWIATSNRWGANAGETIKNQNPPVSRVTLHALEESPVDWERLEQGITGEAARIAGREIRPHQQTALEKAHAHFATSERGKLIMACGTGKTFTSLRIAEHETGGKGLILFLVPSIALLSQTLREWTAWAKEPINAICICSDPKVSRKHTKNEDSDSTSVLDLALPASTDVAAIVRQLDRRDASASSGMTVVFCTYQSIDAIAQAQKELIGAKGSGIFDLVICDEAHRTTGYSMPGEDASAFTKVHDATFIRAARRLYMTATPRLFSDDAKARAAQSDIELCSMDDASKFGEEFYRIGFGEAVERDLLSDYKVLILTLSDQDIPPALQQAIANPEHEISTDDVSRLIGCINALSKQVLGDAGVLRGADPEPMRRAVAFCQTIEVSKKITGIFNSTSGEYVQALSEEKRLQMVSASARHIDGTMSAPLRDELLGWLKSDAAEPGECRVLTNVRCLSEGVDVPALDAVLFLAARNSPVDVVQSVGRVMRTSPGKKYGYIIIPVVVPADMDPAAALADNERYRVVWTVLNALRAHDDRFNATINRIELNRKRPDQILVGRPDAGHYGDGGEVTIQEEGNGTMQAGSDMVSEQLMLRFQQLQNVFFARMVERVGDRRYWEQWATSVARIAQRQIERIESLIRRDGQHQAAFDEFLAGLRKNINPAITTDEAVEMLSQHIITKPVFDALFEGYSFVRHNPVSVSMQRMLDLLEAQSAEEDIATLQKFYDSVRKRAAGIDNAEGKQRIILELYDKFFKTGFPKMVEKLGIVYTPVEVVDFIIHSVGDLLRQEFGRSLSDENVHILDPFTGTGTFVTRLLQSGLIDSGDLERKYASEIHANEIVLLAYYIAAVNIENAFHDAFGEAAEYRPFDGICLTDTFQLGETDELFSEVFASNSERVLRQKNTPLMVIMGNPPYSVGQKSANDNAQNQEYRRLDRRIAETYAAATKATNKNSLYDSYIRAFRWATDRLVSPGTGGIVAFVTNGAWLDGNSNDGFRKHLEKEYSSIWVFNLRGNQRTSGELSRREGGKIFGSGSRTPIAITLLVRKAEKPEGKATIHYRDIGDYLSRDEKLATIRKFGTVGNPAMEWRTLQTNAHGDWITTRNDLFETFIPIGDKADKKSKSFFVPFYSNGVKTQRDAWCYNSSKSELERNIRSTLDFYNEQTERVRQKKLSNQNLDVKRELDYDAGKISWTYSLECDADKGEKHDYNEGKIVIAQYRPFFKQHLYYSRVLNERVYQIPRIFTESDNVNRVICVSATAKEFSVLITDVIPDLHFNGDTQCFPLYYYEKREKQNLSLFDAVSEQEYIRRDGVTDFVLRRAQTMYGKRVTKEDIFYYVYGILHSPVYRTMFADDLKKMLPRIPLVEEPRDFWSFSKAGRQLADLHIGYESAPPCGDVIVTGSDNAFYGVEKMRFPKKGQKDTIIFNSLITISKIPEKAYDYIVNGKSAIEWIMERYQLTTHKESGIQNDPNHWSRQTGNPRYILDLLLSIITVSLRTVEIVENLPELKVE